MCITRVRDKDSRSLLSIWSLIGAASGSRKLRMSQEDTYNALVVEKRDEHHSACSSRETPLYSFNERLGKEGAFKIGAGLNGIDERPSVRALQGGWARAWYLCWYLTNGRGKLAVSCAAHDCSKGDKLCLFSGCPFFVYRNIHEVGFQSHLLHSLKQRNDWKLSGFFEGDGSSCAKAKCW